MLYGSKLYSTILEKGVKDTDTRIQVYIEPSGYVQLGNELFNINQKFGGAATFFEKFPDGTVDSSLLLVFITGKNALSDGEEGVALIHEFAGHAIPRWLEGLEELNAIEIENKIRFLKVTYKV